jgi:hypothetical protein
MPLMIAHTKNAFSTTFGEKTKYVGFVMRRSSARGRQQTTEQFRLTFWGMTEHCDSTALSNTPPITQRAVLCLKVSRFDPFVLLVSADEDEDEYGALVEWYGSTWRKTFPSATLFITNPTWTDLVSNPVFAVRVRRLTV